MKAKAFTLVEILIVVIILGILAAVVLPRFSNATAMARASMLADDLRILRMQINVFKGQHRSTAPGYPGGEISSTPTEDAFVEHMTKSTNETCESAAIGTDGYRFGPYLREVPTNPINGKSSVDVLADDATIPAEGDNSHGWIYHPASMTILADSPGADENGKRYIDY
jgi:general secretion pathway protein G